MLDVEAELEEIAAEELPLPWRVWSFRRRKGVGELGSRAILLCDGNFAVEKEVWWERADNPSVATF